MNYINKAVVLKKKGSLREMSGSCDIGLIIDFLDVIIKHKQQNKKIDKLNFIKIKYFCAKDTIKKMKGKPTKWEKIIVNHVSEKSLVSRIYKEILQLKDKKDK